MTATGPGDRRVNTTVRRRARLLIPITALCTIAACRTGTEQTERAPRTLAAAEPRPASKPAARPPGCGPHGRPLRSTVILRDVEPEDAQIITEQMRQLTGMPLFSIIRRQHGVVEASAGCETSIPDDASMIKARFEEWGGVWTIVGITSQVVQ